MTYTNFPNGITSMGVPTFGAGGMLPFTGNYFFVNETTGSDGNTGGAQDPLATIDRAYALCTANNNDVVFVTGTVHTTATITWAKNFTHLVGLTAPTMTAARARISSSGSTVFTPLVNVTAQGCQFLNLGTFHGFANASAQICWVEAGQRNYYENVSFFGGGNATAAAQAGMRSLTVGAAGQGENTFVNCTIGLDTVTRTAANYSLEFLGGSPRNVFTGCIFSALVTGSGTSGGFVTAGAASIDRYNSFRSCEFVNQTKSSGSAFSQAMNISGSAGGMLVLDSSLVFGCTALETAPTGNIVGMGPTVTNSTVAKALATNW